MGGGQNNNKQTAWFLLFLVVVVAAEVLSSSSSRLRTKRLFASRCGWCKPAQVCAVASRYTGEGEQAHFGIYLPVSFFFFPFKEIKSLKPVLKSAPQWMALLDRLCTHLAVLYIDTVLLDVLHRRAQLLQRFLPVHLSCLNQSLPPRPTQKHTSVSTSHSTSTRGQRMNNAEVASEWKSPPLFPLFSPSLSNKEAMLPWRQWSLGRVAANCSLSCVKRWANGCSGWCCYCHRPCKPIGCALLFDWISDLVFGEEKISQGVPPVCQLWKYVYLFFVFFSWMEKDYLARRQMFLFYWFKSLNCDAPFNLVL